MGAELSCGLLKLGPQTFQWESIFWGIATTAKRQA